jgi:hypothetical protein
VLLTVNRAQGMFTTDCVLQVGLHRTLSFLVFTLLTASLFFILALFSLRVGILTLLRAHLRL